MICPDFREMQVEPVISDWPLAEWPACLRRAGRIFAGSSGVTVEVSKKGKALSFSGHDDAILFKQFIINLP